MNVLYTLDSLNRGGAETIILDICRNASRFGISSAFVAFGGGALEDAFWESDFTSFKINRKAPLDLRLVFRLRKLIRELKIDIVHTSQPVEAVHCYLAVLGTRVKCVQTHQGVFPERRNKLAARLITPLVDSNITVSKSLQRWLEDELRINTERNFRLAYNAVDISRLAPTGRNIRTELGIDDKTVLLGNVGNFLPSGRKDQMTICKALPTVFSKYGEMAFIFAGRTAEGGQEYFDKCVSYCRKKGILDRVFFVGERDDIPDILDSLDVFVFASVAEGLPLALVEAMFSKLPVIVSDIAQHLEVTDAGRCAAVFSTKNSDDLANAIFELITDEKRQVSLAMVGQEYARRTFTMEAHFKILKEIYIELLREST